jgi:hypothetical protein
MQVRAARLESSLDELVRATRLQLQVRLVGGRIGWPTVITVIRLDLDGLEEAERKQGTCSGPDAS